MGNVGQEQYNDYSAPVKPLATVGRAGNEARGTVVLLRR